MPPNPNVQPEFRHQLSAEQTTAVDQAGAQGRAVNTQEMALRNILQGHADPAEALQDLANGRASLEAEWNTLDANAAKNPQEQQRFEQLERQIKGNQQLEASIPTAYQRAHAEELIGYQTMDMTELAGIVSNSMSREQQATAARAAARRVAGATYATDPDYIRANEALQVAKTRRQEAEDVFNQRDQPARDQQAQRQQEAVRQAQAARENERQQEEARVQAQRTQLEGVDVKGLRNEIVRLNNQVTELTGRRAARAAAGAGAEELAEIDRDLARAQERNTESDRILGNKLTGATEAIDQDTAKKAEENFASRATSAQLRDEIEVRQINTGQLRTNIVAYRDELDNPATGAVRRREVQNLLYDATEQLNREEEVLKLHQDTLSKSNREFRAMNANDRAAELAKIGEDLDMNNYNLEHIHDRLVNGEDVTKEDLAAWTKLTIGELAANGRANVNMGELNGILAMRPDLRMALADGFKNSETARKLLREKLPNGWEKIWDFAKKHPNWLMILLGIIAGTTTVATAGLGAVAGVGVAGAGTVASGAGITSRRNWS